MTYGVYTRDLHSMSISNLHSIAECKQYIWDDDEYVVCSEKEVWCSFSIKFTFHKWRGFKCSRLDSGKVLGFVTIEKKNNYYTWADQIMYDPKKEGGTM